MLYSKKALTAKDAKGREGKAIGTSSHEYRVFVSLVNLCVPCGEKFL